MKNLLKRYFASTPVHAPIVPARDPQCTATTKSGARCKFPAIGDTGRCTLPAHRTQPLPS